VTLRSEFHGSLACIDPARNGEASYADPNCAIDAAVKAKLDNYLHDYSERNFLFHAPGKMSAMRASTDGGGRRSGGGGSRDGRLRMAALADGRAVVRVLGSASLRADAVGRRRAPSRVGSIYGEMFRSKTSRPSRRSAVCGRRTPESVLRACHVH